MIVGRGTIAKAFLASQYDWEDFVILASGVPNSSETDDTAYQRERDLIDSYLGTEKCVVYFSTVSVFDTQKVNTPYVEFKREMEKYIANSFAKRIVIRLPIVLGLNNNPNQLFGYIRQCIAKNEKLTIYRNATRYFMDVNEVPKAAYDIAQWMYKNKKYSLSINVGFQQKLSMGDVADVIQKKYPNALLNRVDKGTGYEVDFTYFQKLVNNGEYRSSDVKSLIYGYL